MNKVIIAHNKKGKEMDAKFVQELRNRIVKGVAVFNKYVPEWRDMVKAFNPYRSPDIINALFGFSSKYEKSCITELYRRRLAGTRGRGNANASEQSFLHEIGICLYEDEPADHEELMGLWHEAMDDPKLKDILPPYPRAYFHTANNGGVCCRWNGQRGEKIGFPEKFHRPLPKDGEWWEVIGEEMNANRALPRFWCCSLALI